MTKQEWRRRGCLNLTGSCLKSIVGIPILAKKLVEIQATSIGRRLLDIVKKINEMKQSSVDRVREMIEMEKNADYTCNPEYTSTWNALMSQQSNFMKALNDQSNPVKFTLSEYGEVDIGHLREKESGVQQAYDMNMRLTSYWKIVLKRLVDSLGLHLLFSVQNLVNKEMEGEILNELMGPDSGGIQRLLEESPSVASRREKLKKCIKLLKDSEEIVSKIMDKIASQGNLE